MIPAVVLAAGASMRMGRPKALLPITSDGETFLARVLKTLVDGGADDLVVVVGAHAESISEAMARMPILARTVENKSYSRGQLSSLVTALDVIERPGVLALMAMPVDVPLVSAGTVQAVRTAYLERRPLVARPSDGSRHGHPVIFDRRLFAELRAADFSRGARSVIAAHLDAVLDVAVHDPGAFEDIDTPDDYARHVGLPLDA